MMQAVKTRFGCVVFVVWMLLVSGGMAYAAEEEDMRVLWATKPLVLPEHEVGASASVVTGYKHLYVGLALKRGGAGGVLAALERKSGEVGWLRPLERAPAGNPPMLAVEYWDNVLVSSDVAIALVSKQGVRWKLRVLPGEEPLRMVGVHAHMYAPDWLHIPFMGPEWLIKHLSGQYLWAVSREQVMSLGLSTGDAHGRVPGVVPSAHPSVILGDHMTCLARLPGNHGRERLCQMCLQKAEFEEYEMRWILDEGTAGVQGAPTAFDWQGANVYCALSDGAVIEVDGDSGKAIRRLKTGFTRAPVSIRIIGKIVCGTVEVPDTADARRVVVECIDLKDDKLKWRKEFRNCVAPPVWSDRGVWVLREKGVSRIVAADGMEQAVELTEAPLMTGGIGAAEQNRLYCVDALGRMLCIEDASDVRKAEGWPFDATEALRRQQKAARALRTEVQKELDLGGGVKMKLALIPAGEFMMGSPPEEASNVPDSAFEGAPLDEGQHVVRITKAFYIGVTEVTQGQYERIMGVNPSRQSQKAPTKPVDSVTWDDAQEFCRRLGKVVKAEVRLPTEAEWEYACRAGTAGPYHVSGDAWDQIACHDGTYGRPLPVGTKKPNVWGLHDMHGNVFEWCQDWYDWTYYRRSPEEHPTGPSYGKYRVLRSGSAFLLPEFCRSAQRSCETPDGKDWGHFAGFQIGFRVVMSVE